MARMTKKINPSPEGDDLDVHDISKGISVSEKTRKEKKTAETRTLNAKNKKEERKGERSFYILLGVIVVALILLIFGYQLVWGKTKIKTIDELHSENLAEGLEAEEGYIYNGFSFVKANDQWWTRFQRAENGQTYNVQLRYGPRDLADVPVVGDYVYFLHFNASFVTFDPLGNNLSYVALAASDISQAMVRVFDIVTFPACTRQDNISCTDLPILECEPGKPVVYLKEDATPFVEMKETCMVIHGEGLGLVKAVDRLLLAWYGIMP